MTQHLCFQVNTQKNWKQRLNHTLAHWCPSKCSVIHSSPKVKTTQCPPTNTQTKCSIYNWRVVFSHKKNWSSDTYYNMGTLKNIILSEISQREKDKLIRSRVRSLAQKIVSIFERNELLLFLSFISYSYTYKLRINLYFYTYLKLLLKYWFREFF